MWLTAREAAHELRITTNLIKRLRKRQQIRWVKIGTQYRYELPKPTEADIVPPVERVAMLAYNEVAEILGMTRIGVRVAVHEGRIHPIRVGRRNYVTIKELRRVLAEREKRTGQKKQAVSRILCDWVRGYLKDGEIQVQVLDKLIQEAVKKLPDPARSEAITKLWNHFDAVNAILQQIDGRGTGN